jgi:D-alanyl-lipoteichoic acid acyltransferase DltB (MBOAT superfamily)
MLFNSFAFLVFFIAITALNFALPHRFRWPLLLAGSCLFYMTFVPIYILILFATIAIDYFAGIGIESTEDPSRKKCYLLMSVLSVCGILFLFKYFNFFNDNLSAIATALHLRYSIQSLRIILPIGLSFHTFQSLSYVIEVYRGRQKAERHFGIYALYVMYFPQLVAGPIERPQNLLHQFHQVQCFDWNRVRDGLLQALWGLFKKVVVADSLAVYVDAIYNSSRQHSGPSLLMATYFFAFQIYCDFSGYSDLARGISKVYGIDLMKNFETPYFAASIGEFWSRWHISLSTWFRDYVYIPLGGSRAGLGRTAFNLFAVFLLSGLWHGANWTFVVWGALHGVYLVTERLAGLAKRRYLPFREWQSGKMWHAARVLMTFHLVLVSWIFFRAENIGAAISILRKILTDRGPLYFDSIIIQASLAVGVLFSLEILRRRIRLFGPSEDLSLRWRTAFAVGLIFAVVLFGVDRGTQFIYYQF